MKLPRSLICFVFSSDSGYCCTGNLTEWTKCIAVTKTPERRAFRIPSEYTDVTSLWVTVVTTLFTTMVCHVDGDRNSCSFFPSSQLVIMLSLTYCKVRQGEPLIFVLDLKLYNACPSSNVSHYFSSCRLITCYCWMVLFAKWLPLRPPVRLVRVRE